MGCPELNAALSKSIWFFVGEHTYPLHILLSNLLDAKRDEWDTDNKQIQEIKPVPAEWALVQEGTICSHLQIEMSKQLCVSPFLS